MRLSGFPRLYPFLVVLAALPLAAALTVISPLTRGTARADCAASSPCPTPTPVNAFLSIDVSAGGPSQVINVTGGQFLPNEQVTLYWDQTNHVAGSATSDPGGSFNTRVKPFSGDQPGVHHLCASVPPHPCANFSLQSATPSPSPSPSADTSPSPLPSASADTTPTSTVVSPARIAATNLSGFEVISRPPFVFLPVFGIGALLLAAAWYLVNVVRRPRRLTPLPSAAVVHRATRPDYSASFGTPPPHSTAPEPEASAWNEPMRAVTPSPGTAPEQHVQWGPPVEWGTGQGDWGFPDPPAQEETEGPPQPTD